MEKAPQVAGLSAVMGAAGFEPAKAEPSDLQSDPFDRLGNPPRHLRRLIAPHGGLTRPRPSDTWQATRGRQRRRSLWRAVRPIDSKHAALFTYYELAGGLEPSTC